MGADRLRILVVKPVLPYPPDQGTKVVSYDMIRALSARHEVTVLARILDRDEAARARELERVCARVVTVLPPNRRSFLHRAAYKGMYTVRSWVSRRSMKSLYDCPDAFVAAARALAAESFDLVVVEYWQLYPLLRVFPRERTVLLTHDIDMLVNRQQALLERRLPRKIRLVRKWLAEQREEARAYRDARCVLALPERDAEAVRKLTRGGTAVEVLPVGLAAPPGGDTPPPAGGHGNREVLFMGALSAGFNRDALIHFVREIYPHLADERGVRFTVVGGALPREVRRFAALPGVEVVGRVRDVRPFLLRASCLVVPLRYGGGLRVRILEAMHWGLPVVCTPVAIAGMDFEPGRHFAQGGTGAELADRVRLLLGDAEAAQRMALAARERVSTRYGADEQGERLRKLMERLASV
jgi:glycosyltransferase involved in cell wall biosynthesis